MIGTMPKSQDIHLSDAGLRSQFVSLFTSGDYTGAFDVLNNNPQLDNKKIVADALNALNVAITYLENLYYTNVDNFLASELVRLQTAIDRYRKIGTYSGAVQYQVNNFVIYNSLAYMCIATPPIGTLPTDVTYWEEVGLKGEQGASSLNLTLRYEWSNLTSYSIRDVVVYEEDFYVAKKNNVGKIPSISTADWEILLTINRRYIHTEILDDLLIDDDIWYKSLATTWNFLDTSAKSWNTIDGLILTWNEFERGAYNG